MLGYSATPDANSANALPTMRLAGEDSQVTPQQRNARKRKTPPESVPDQQQQQPPPQPPPPQIHHVLPPMMHPMQAHPLPPGYPYADFTPGGMPPPPPQHPSDPQAASQASASAGRALSNSKRAEQNRKAQRAFRERRDQHVKALESRSQLLDAALASADEANRRWEECRALVDQLRIENAALRAAIQQHQVQALNPGIPPPPPGQPPTPQPQNGLQNHNTGIADQQQIEAARSLEAVVSDSLKSESAEATEKKVEQ